MKVIINPLKSIFVSNKQKSHIEQFNVRKLVGMDISDSDDDNPDEPSSMDADDNPDKPSSMDAADNPDKHFMDAADNPDEPSSLNAADNLRNEISSESDDEPGMDKGVMID